VRRGVVVLDVGEDGFGGEGSPLTPSPCSVSLWLGVIGRRPSSCCLVSLISSSGYRAELSEAEFATAQRWTLPIKFRVCF